MFIDANIYMNSVYTRIYTYTSYSIFSFSFDFLCTVGYILLLITQYILWKLKNRPISQ